MQSALQGGRAGLVMRTRTLHALAPCMSLAKRLRHLEVHRTFAEQIRVRTHEKGDEQGKPGCEGGGVVVERPVVVLREGNDGGPALPVLGVGRRLSPARLHEARSVASFGTASC